MASWRDDTSEQAQADLDEMVNASLNAAQALLADNGEFLPFGIGVSSDGELRAFGVDGSVLPAEPSPKDVVDALRAGFVSRRAELRGVAVVADVLLKQPGSGEAINVSLEHSEGTALDVQLPYFRSSTAKEPTYGDVSASPAQPKIWGD